MTGYAHTIYPNLHLSLVLFHFRSFIWVMADIQGSFSLFCHLVVKGEHMKMFLMSLPRHHCTANPLIVTNGDPFTTAHLIQECLGVNGLSLMRRSLFMSAHFLLYVIALHFTLFITILLFSVKTKLRCGQSWSSTLHSCPRPPQQLMLVICVSKSAWFIWSTQPCTDLPIRTSACLLSFPSFSWSIMKVYRITVLSFTHSALIFDRWLAFAFNITQNSFPKRPDFFPPSDESTPDMRQSRKQTFFSVAVLTTVKCDLFKTRYMFLRGGRGELRTVLKGNMSDGCQPPPISWYVFFLSYTQVFPLVISYIGLQKDKFT